MTVCISAIADKDEAIVSCVDTRISTNQTSIDLIVGRKMCGMRGWTMLSSGTTCYSEALADTFQALLLRAEDNDPPTIQRLLESALLTELMKYGESRYLAPYGIDMPTFMNSTDAFSDERRNELSRLIADHSESYDVELIISGWGQTQESFGPDQAPSACIYSVSRDGILPHSDDGFYTCGTGKDSAHAILSYFSLERHMTLAEALYRVAVAKFMCERTDGVGPNTVLRVATRCGKGEWRGYFIQPAEIAQIRAVWDASGAPRMTDEAEDIIVAILKKHGPQHVSLDHMVRTVQKDIIQHSKRPKSEK